MSKNNKVIGSNYFGEEADERIREVLRDAMGRNVKGKPLPKFYATWEEYETKLFEAIDKAVAELCDECPDKNAERDEDREPQYNEGYE